MLSDNRYFIDVFAGAGGLSEGFVRQGFHSLGEVDSDAYACSTLKTRMAYWWLKNKGDLSLYQEYIKGNVSQEELYSEVEPQLDSLVLNRIISKNTIRTIIKKIRNNMDQEGVDKLDILLGAPPCQAYSSVGKARLSLERANVDPRTVLYKQYIRLVKEFQPYYFVFENVPAIQSTRDGEIIKTMEKKFKKMGYNFKPQVLNSKDYYILQNRKRMIMVGWSKEVDGEYPEPSKTEHSYQVAEIFKDLPQLKPGEGKDVMEYYDKPNGYLTSSGIRKNWEILTHHIARPHNSRDIQIYKKVISAWNESGTRLKYNELPEKLQTHNNKDSFLDRFKVVADNEMHSHTIVAHISKDGHYYIHPDIMQARSLTPREAARLQSFPDDYYFEGPRTAKFRQIGNAVPPLLSQAFAIKIREMIN